MNNLLFRLNFGCMRFTTRSQETYRTIFVSHHEHKNKKIYILRLINNLGFFTGSKNIISLIKKDNRRSKKYSIDYDYTKQNTILSYKDESGTHKPSYNDLFDYHNPLVMYYLFGIFNTNIYTCLNFTYKVGEVLITGSKLGTYYIQDYMNSISYKRPAHFMITGHERVLKIISKRSNIIPLEISYGLSVINNKKTNQFYSNIEKLQKLLIKKNKEICTSTETENIFSYISINCKITKHIIDLCFQNNIFNILLDKSKEIENTLKIPTYLNVDRNSLNLYFDISTLTFIVANSFDIRLLHFDLGLHHYNMIIRVYTYILVNNRNTVSIKYTIEQHTTEQNDYTILYQDKLDYEDIKDEEHLIDYEILLNHYKETIKNEIVGKIFE